MPGEYTILPEAAYVTQAGEALIAKLTACKGALTFTRATLGSGEMPEGESPYTQLHENGYVMDAMIEGATNPNNGESAVGIQVSSIGVAAGFPVTNIALFAQDPDDGEICYGYMDLHEHPEWIRPEGMAVNNVARFILYIIVKSVPVVHAFINPDVFITHSQLQTYFVTVIRPACLQDAQGLVAAHNQSPTAHPDIRNYVSSNDGRITELEKLMSGKSSVPFRYIPSDWKNVTIIQGVRNDAALRLDY
ncbi:MAG: phage tail protein [Oscillospiraceae bacterium]|jgi:hypothetical protein|nr:phage tail protein [Oscillospiraceae bacterium]